MSRLTLYSMLFFVGFALAFILMHGIHLIVKEGTHDSQSARARMADVPSEISVSRADSDQGDEGRSLSVNIQHILSGIRLNNPNAIRLLHSDFFNEYSYEEQKKYLPQIKNEILRKLARELSRSDWLQWSASENDGNVKKTSARNFIDTLRVVNSNLGRYAETAALLFSGLYYATSSGRIFSPEEELYNLMLEADQLFRQRTPAALSSRVHLDIDITQDVTFQVWLERLRARFIAQFCLKEPRQIENQFYLLSTIKEEYFSEIIVKIYSELLNTVTRRISPRFREELRNSYLAPDEVRRMLSYMPELAPRIEEFYQTSFDDKVVLGDKSKARSVYLQYSSFFPDSVLLKEYQKEIAGLDSVEAHEQTKPELIPAEHVDVQDGKIETARKGAFSFGEGRENSSQGALVSKIERAGIIVILLLGLGLFIRKRWRLIKDRIFRKKLATPVSQKRPLDNVEPIDRSPRLRSVTRGKSRPHDESKKKVVND